MTPSLLLLLLLSACKPEPECSVTSTIPGYMPLCDEAVLTYYTGESRLHLPGEGGEITAYLPGTLDVDTYGGESGNYLLVVIQYDDGSSEQPSDTRGTTLTIGEIDENEAELRLQFSFDSGDVFGPLTVPVEERG